MKKKLIVIALAACAIALAGCKVVSEPEPIAVESVTLSETTLSLAPGDAMKLTATVKPDNAEDKSVKWSSSDEAVAMVSSDGKVVAIETGTAAITAQAGGKTAICVVNVKEAAAENPDSPVVNPDTPVVNPDSPVAVDNITLSATTLTIEPGKTRTLTATVTPNNADDKAVTWSSSNMSIATVNEDGIVTAHTEGIVTITARAGDKEATCTVTVKRILIAVERVSLEPASLMLTRGETGKLAATVMPSNADDTTVAWVSSNSDVATVGNDGTVTAVKTGTATITAQAGDITAECTVIVNPILVQDITLDTTTLTLAPCMTGKLTATVNPENADDKTVKWSSSNTSVAMVDNDGTIGAINTGKTTITAQAGDKKATCVVTVHTDHSYSGGKCTLCGAKPYLEGGKIDDNGILWEYTGGSAMVIIPKGVTSIGDRAFFNCNSLTSVDIPEGVTSIGLGAFNGCSGLTSVTIPASVSFIGNEASRGCRSLTSMDIPEGVTSIGDLAFRGCSSLTSVDIPSGVTSIGQEAFHGCTNLTSVTIPDSVTSIGGLAFYVCTNLTRIQFNGIKAQWNAIKGSGLDITCIICSDGHIGVKDVPSYLKMSGRTVTGYTDTVPAALVIPDGVQSIGWGAFRLCSNLGEVTIPEGVTNIGNEAFSGCKNLTSITIPTSVTVIGYRAFNGCTSLAGVTIPEGVTSIGKNMFEGCYSLESITIPGGVTSIGEGSFAGCTSLKSVVIPEGVTSIDVRAFVSCNKLNRVNYDGTKAEWDKISIDIESGLSGKTIIGSDGSTWTAE